MSDNFAIRRYHRQTAPVPCNTTKKRSFGLFLLILACVALTVFLVYNLGIPANDNPRIPQQMVTRINLERQANSLEPVQVDSLLGERARARSRDVNLAVLTYAAATDISPGENANVFVIPKFSWVISGYDARQQMFDALENRDSSFRSHILDSSLALVGIGVSSDLYNYYIVTQWQ